MASLLEGPVGVKARTAPDRVRAARQGGDRATRDRARHDAIARPAIEQAGKQRERLGAVVGPGPGGSPRVRPVTARRRFKLDLRGDGDGFGGWNL